VDAVLLFDGACLRRPALHASRDLRIFVAVDFAEVLRRALERDLHAFGSADEVEWRSNGVNDGLGSAGASGAWSTLSPGTGRPAR
jgi:hypothetical protein